MISPAITNVSLFAKATFLPASTAAKVLGKPALPTIAATTTSTSVAVAISGKASGPTRTFVPGKSDRSQPLGGLGTGGHENQVLHSLACSAEKVHSRVSRQSRKHSIRQWIEPRQACFVRCCQSNQKSQYFLFGS